MSVQFTIVRANRLQVGDVILRSFKNADGQCHDRSVQVAEVVPGRRYGRNRKMVAVRFTGEEDHRFYVTRARVRKISSGLPVLGDIEFEPVGDHYVAELMKKQKCELQEIAVGFGVKFNTKTTKADLAQGIADAERMVSRA